MSVPSPATPSFEPSSLVGVTLDGRYVLTGHLATGGMGAVFRARHVHLRKEFGVKVLRPDLTSSPDIVERFRREAEIASALEHDNIVRVTDFGRSESGHLFLVMELLAGESLYDRLRREGFLPPEEAVPILWQVCSGLEAAHALGVVHRDLKPENVFLARTASGREVAKLLDFGIAKIADPTSGTATQSGIVVGTPEYLSPEQAVGSQIDARADIYAVGLIAWRMLAGRHPFKAEDPRALLMMQATRPVPPLTELRPDLEAYPGLVAAVAKAAEKDPALRHQTAAELRDDLAAALGPAFVAPPGATPHPSLGPSPSPLPRPQRRRSVARPAFEAGSDPTRTVTPPFAMDRTALPRARLARAARRLREGARRALAATPVAELPRRVAANPVPWLVVALTVLTGAGATVAVAWRQGLAAKEARALLESERPAEAHALLEAALGRRPEDPELLLLRARALHRIPGQAGAAVEAYAAARARGPLDEVALEDLVSSLGRDRALADLASRVLRDEGERAIPAVLRAATNAPGAHRLRALALARDLGAEERIDRIGAYGDLLTDVECEVRRAAAHRLGELGDPAALPRLRTAAGAKVETKGFFGSTRTSPACGAPEAAAAARRIEAANAAAAAAR